MKVRTCLSVSAMCLLIVSPALAFDVPSDGMTEMNRAIYGTVFADLMVGDKMRIGAYSTCVSDGLLMVSGAAPFRELDTWASDFTAEILAGSEVAITISTANMDSPSRTAAYLRLEPCSDTSGIRYYPVKSVNGFETLDAYLKSGFITKLPKP